MASSSGVNNNRFGNASQCGAGQFNNRFGKCHNQCGIFFQVSITSMGISGENELYIKLKRFKALKTAGLMHTTAIKMLFSI